MALRIAWPSSQRRLGSTIKKRVARRQIIIVDAALQRHDAAGKYLIMNNAPRPAQFRIYKDVVCLEDYDPRGHLWWDLGVSLQFRPYRIKDVPCWRYGQIVGSNRRVLMAEVEGRLIAVNPPRSDVLTLQALGLWPTDLSLPFDMCEYTPYPEKLHWGT
jgi:hypothetical protein